MNKNLDSSFAFLRAFSYVNDLLSDGTSAYESYMKNFQRQVFKPIGLAG